MYKKWIGLLIVGATIFAAAIPAFSDYTISPEFDVGKPVILTGTVTKVEWTDPKAWFYFDVKDTKTGLISNWAVELGTLNGLMRLGWDPTTITNASDIQWADGRKILAEFFVEEQSNVGK